MKQEKERYRRCILAMLCCTALRIACSATSACACAPLHSQSRNLSILPPLLAAAIQLHKRLDGLSVKAHHDSLDAFSHGYVVVALCKSFRDFHAAFRARLERLCCTPPCLFHVLTDDY